MFSTADCKMPAAMAPARRATRPTRASNQDLVELAVIVAVERHHLVATGDRTRDTQRGHHRFGAGVAERHPLIAGHLGEQGGDLARQFRLRPSCETVVQLFLDRFDDEIGGVPERRWSIAVDEVDVFVAVNVPDARAARAVADQRVDEFLPFRSEAGGRPGIRERRARCSRALLGASRLRRQTRGERVDVSPLRWGNAAVAAYAGPIDLESRRLPLGVGTPAGAVACCVREYAQPQTTPIQRPRRRCLTTLAA